MLDLEEARRMLVEGRALRDSLKSVIADMDDVSHDIDHSDDHATTSVKLSKVVDELDGITNVPKRSET